MSGGRFGASSGPVVSVCVTTYNHAPFIRECLDGILKQRTEFSYEICLGEDDSDDGTRSICEEYAEKYPSFVRLLKRKRKDVIEIDGRPTGRYNFLETLKVCEGKYIAICEGDDYWIDPYKLQKQVDYLERNPSYSLCYCNVKIVYEDRSLKSHVGYSEKKFSKKHYKVMEVPGDDLDGESLVGGNRIHSPTVVFRNWIRGDGLPDKLFMEAGIGDWPLHLMTLQKGNGAFINEVMATYRVHRGGIWSMQDNARRRQGFIRTMCAILNSGVFSTSICEGVRNMIVSSYIGAWNLSAYNGDMNDVKALYEYLCEELPEMGWLLMKAVWLQDVRQNKWIKRARAFKLKLRF